MTKTKCQNDGTDEIWTELCESFSRDIVPRLLEGTVMDSLKERTSVYYKWIWILTLLLFVLQFIILFCALYIVFLISKLSLSEGRA